MRSVDAGRDRHSPCASGSSTASGAVLAWLYDIVGNYGIAIILLTVVLKIVLLPLGMKQIKSMQAHAGAAAEDQGAAEEVQGQQAEGSRKSR